MRKKLKIILILGIIIVVSIVIINFLSIKLMYPKKFSEYVEKYSDEVNIESEIIYSMIKAESNFDKDVVSTAGAKGLMQLIPSTAQEVAEKNELEYSEEKLFEAEYNIKLGVFYYKTLYEKYNNAGLALAAYNAGSGNVDKWIESNIIKSDGSDLEKIPFDETNTYVRKILRDYEIYKKIYD